MKRLFKGVVAGLVAPVLSAYKLNNRTEDDNPA